MLIECSSLYLCVEGWMNALLYNAVIKPQFNSNLQSSVLKRLLHPSYRFFSMTSREEEPELNDFLSYLNSLTNYEKSGVPKDAGTDSDDGLDLGRMHRLMSRLSNPHHNFKAVHIAGTKGKGSTATFLSSILRAEGYSVGCYSSPHIMTLRERMTLGKCGHPVSAEVLNSLFRRIKAKLDEVIESENGCLTHFEVLTATAFTLFADEHVDIAVIEAGLGGARDATNIIRNSELAASVITTIGEEHLAALGGSLESIALAKSGIIKQGCPVILGGPFCPNIESILRDKASVMSSPVVCASEAAIKASINSIHIVDGRPCQLSDIIIKVNGQSLELNDVKLRMVGRHQLQNAATAACTALCLRDQGWLISDASIVTGLENAYLLGRSQFLSSKEAEALGLPGATVLVDGAHTKDSAKALMETIQMVCPEAHLALVVAMASDKDHVGFARECLSITQPEAVFLTEVAVAGGISRTTPASLLMERWTQASEELGIIPVQDFKNQLGCSTSEHKNHVLLFAKSTLMDCLRSANEILKRRMGNTEKQSDVIVVTGSLHVVSSVLASLHT